MGQANPGNAVILRTFVPPTRKLKNMTKNHLNTFDFVDLQMEFIAGTHLKMFEGRAICMHWMTGSEICWEGFKGTRFCHRY